MQNITQNKITTLFGVLFALAACLPAHAAEFSWRENVEGNWNQAARWDPVGFTPTLDDNVSVGQGLVKVGNGIAGLAGSLNVSSSKVEVVNSGALTTKTTLNVGGGGEVTVSDAGSVINVGTNAFIGDQSSGFLNVSNGASVVVSSGLYIGRMVGSNGTLRLSDGTVSAQQIQLGLVGGNGTIEIAGTGQGKLLDTNGGAVALSTGGGTGTVKFTHTGNSLFENAMSGAISIEHSGTGLTALTANSSITGAMTISDGRLLVEASSFSASGGISVTGGSLGGVGTVTGGRVTVSAAAHLEASLTLAAGLTLEDGAHLDYVEGSFLTLTGGDLVVNGSVQVDFGGALLEAGNVYVLIDGTSIGGLTDLDPGSFVAAGGVDGKFHVDGGKLVFEVTSAVPEPASYAVIAGLALLIWGVLRRRPNRLRQPV